MKDGTSKRFNGSIRDGLSYHDCRERSHRLMKIASKHLSFAGLLFVGLLGCKDQGSLPPAPKPTGSLSTGLDTLFTFPQDTVLITISGGILPYSVQGLSSSTILTYRITDSTLTALPNALGSDIARISDASSPANQLDLPVVVGTPVSFSSSIQPIFVSSYGCSGTVGGCHGGTMGMYLDNAAVSYQNLVNVTTQSTQFPGLKRVFPRDLAHSVLYIRLSSNDPAISMPQGRPTPFNPTYLANVRTWILQGAHFN